MRKISKYLKVIIILISVLVAMTWIDIVRVKASKRPIFVIPIAFYKDGGSKVLSGLGYTIIELHRISMLDLGGGEYKERVEVGYEYNHWIFPWQLRRTKFEEGRTISRGE
jgi:hypothetical protein